MRYNRRYAPQTKKDLITHISPNIIAVLTRNVLVY